MPADFPTQPVSGAAPTMPGLDTLTAAASCKRSALAEVLAYTHRFVTSYCRAALGPEPISDNLATQLGTAITTGWPAAWAARRDFLEFAYTSAHRAVRICRYQVPHQRLSGPLTDRQREIITLRVPVGLSPLETAVALDIPVRDVHRETRRAFAVLRAHPHVA
ncbi:hypothetical protein GL305_32215 [Nocardia seriolae]|uniref:hypothetical protein n=1 Tax=Nocardia seriolae TaxID=37332 RepID=UPI0012BD5832|nr:hypothetical protein [Nocardia seriolae]MTJ90501.1 hypothetical protein [Nocardia seriolae]MTK34461.1 hypothetical protein [Nocardia seriolae]MTK43615.1 hypothetical protein [Nocardia seriolae]